MDLSAFDTLDMSRRAADFGVLADVIAALGGLGLTGVFESNVISGGGETSALRGEGGGAWPPRLMAT